VHLPEPGRAAAGSSRTAVTLATTVRAPVQWAALLRSASQHADRPRGAHWVRTDARLQRCCSTLLTGTA
jgi:hypothetical protein